jgi:hypothetical protein
VRQGQFGEDYVRVLASAAGLTVFRYNLDIHGVDLGICRDADGRYWRSPKIEVQVKTVSRPQHDGGTLVFHGLSSGCPQTSNARPSSTSCRWRCSRGSRRTRRVSGRWAGCW